MSTKPPLTGKIIQHSEGLGAPSPEDVRKRAAELALIAGHAEVSSEDWRQAKRELHGGRDGHGDDGEFAMAAMVSERTMIRCDVGHRVENIGMEDAVNMVEELIAEGMDEAVHEQMLAARLQEEREEEED
jgi:hypothetical protein